MHWYANTLLGGIIGTYLTTSPGMLPHYAKGLLRYFHTDVEVIHKEKYDNAKKLHGVRCISVFNHGHFLDILALMAGLGGYSYVFLEKHVQSVPLLKNMLESRYGCVVVPSQTSRNGVTEKIKDKLDARKRGENLLMIAPDGGWSTQTSWPKWRTGAFVYATVVVPICITYDPGMPTWESKTSFVEEATHVRREQRKIRIRIQVLDPILRLEGESVDDFCERTRNKMMQVRELDV